MSPPSQSVFVLRSSDQDCLYPFRGSAQNANATRLLVQKLETRHFKMATIVRETGHRAWGRARACLGRLDGERKEEAADCLGGHSSLSCQAPPDSAGAMYGTRGLRGRISLHSARLCLESELPGRPASFRKGAPGHCTPSGDGTDVLN